ncbi:MAG TPA: hypothetical protein VIH90_03760 [Candidatus Saccharimonadales bacterium]
MSNEQGPQIQEVDQHLELLASRLQNVPELAPAFDFINTNPEYARNTYENYVGLVIRMTKLTDAEQLLIARSQKTMRDTGGVVGSASRVDSHDILEALGGKKDDLETIARRSTDPKSPLYQATIDRLVTKMEGGHRLKLNGKTPSDFDPDSLKVIWGHTLITGQEALVHFVICHYLGLYFEEELAFEGYDFAHEKDFFVNSLTDIVILDRDTTSEAADRFKLWSRPKNQGGLGWITEDRLKSYSTEI